MKETIIAQLVSMKNQIAALESQVDAALSILCIENDTCQHPKDQRVNLSTMGQERWQCKACGYLYEEVKG